MPKSTTTVAQHLLNRVAQMGAAHVIGVPGDYSFPITDAACVHPEMKWVGCCSELNAAYMADGYARVRGIGVLTTTFGVGELSALNGIAGAFAERVPVVHLVGMPATSTQALRSIVHHTLGDGDFGAWAAMSSRISCASALLTVDNAVAEIERCLNAAAAHSQPVYIGIPADVAETPLSNSSLPQIRQPLWSIHASDHDALHAAAEEILERIANSRRTCILVGSIVARLGLRKQTTDFVEASGLPFATMWMDKSILDETHPQHCGMYSGSLANDQVREFVESSDLVINLGAILSDLNTGIYTAQLDRMRCITIMRNTTTIAAAAYRDVHMSDLLRMLSVGCKRAPKKSSWPSVQGLGAPQGDPDGPIASPFLFPSIEQFMRTGDMVFAETGTISMGLLSARMPRGADFMNQALWGSVGWAVPAGIGGALADQTRRTVIVTGEGAHQFSPQELGTASRMGLNPIIIVVNNSGYLTERILCRDPEMQYNDVQPWNYSALPEAMGCAGWKSTRVQTCSQFAEALAAASHHGNGTYIEVMTPRDDLPPFGKSIRNFLRSMRGAQVVNHPPERPLEALTSARYMA